MGEDEGPRTALGAMYEEGEITEIVDFLSHQLREATGMTEAELDTALEAFARDWWRDQTEGSWGF